MRTEDANLKQIIHPTVVISTSKNTAESSTGNVDGVGEWVCWWMGEIGLDKSALVIRCICFGDFKKLA